ncbi:MAG TPA: hypothetical protein V6C95_16700 [Coleofasciculaceae cyanobacterium]
MLTARGKRQAIRITVNVTLATVTGVCLFLGTGDVRNAHNLQEIGVPSATAQMSRPQDVWQQVYQRLPNLPLENQYVSKETGEVDADNTLVSRLIRYHLYVKNRLPNFRFDWKMTMADFLGANDYLVEEQYPSANTLTANPMEGDRAAIEKLSRAEREALVNTLASLFSPTITQTPAPEPSASPSPPANPNPRGRLLTPQPGDAQLLLP